MNNLVAFCWYDKLNKQWKTAVTADEEAFDVLLFTNPNVGARSRVDVQELINEKFNLTYLNSPKE